MPQIGKLPLPPNYINNYTPHLPTQNQSVLPNIHLIEALHNIDEIYYNVKSLVDDKLLLGTDEGNYALHMNRYLTILGKGDSIGFCDWFKYIMKTYGVQEYASINKSIKSQSKIIVPTELLSPPPINTKRIVYNSVLGTVKGLTNEDAYLHNFKIDFNKLSPLRLISSDKYDSMNTNKVGLDDNQIVNNIKHGLHRMFADQVKPRSLNPLQSLIHAVFSYRCDICAIESRTDCKCYLYSPELMALSQFIETGKGIPFFILTVDSKSVKNPNYNVISSIIPSLWYILLDLSLRNGCGAICSSLSAGIINLWLQSSITSLFGAILGKFKKIKDIIKFIINKTDFISIEVSSSNDIIGSHHSGPHGIYNKLEYNEFLKDNNLHNLFVSDLPSLTNDEGRELINMIQYIVTPSIPIKTPISLSMGMSAQATNEIGGVLQQPTEFVLIKDNWVPIKFKYEDGDMEWMRAELFELLEQYPPDLTRLESKFIEASTTNSAGVDPSKLAAIRAEILKELGSDDPDAKELAANAGVRIFDMLRVILKSLSSVDALLHEWDTVGVSGIRVQVGRRNRLIQMLSSIFMCAPFLIKVILEDIITNSGIGATGKTTNDVRDMHVILYASGREIYILFADVVGMDTNTYGPQQKFITEPINAYLQRFRDQNLPFFLNKVDGITQPIKVRKRRLNQITGNLDEYDEYVSVLEYFTYLDSTLIDEKRRVSDGYFFREIMASNITFPSGSYKTSTQHTILLILVYRRVKFVLERKYSQVGLKVVAQVLGDDQIGFCTTVDSGTVPLLIATEMQELINNILAKFAYVTDSGMGYCHGEFLKQVGYYGGPSPLGSRLAQYACETGSSYALSNIERMKNACGVADELSARVKYPNYTKIIKRIAGMVLSFVGVKTKIDTTFHSRSYQHHTNKAHARRVGKQQKLTSKTHKLFTNINNFGTDLTWKNKFGEIVILKIIKGAWYCVPNIGVPHYPMQFEHTFKIGDNWLAFPSPYTLKCILDLCHRKVVDIDALLDRNLEIIKSSEDGLKNLLNTMPSLIRRSINAKIKSFGLNAVTQMMISDRKHIPISTTDKVDSELLNFYGFTDGYYIEELLRVKLDKYEPGPAFKEIENFGNSFLDRGKVNASHLASYQLDQKYGFKISDTVAYYNRIGARIRSAAASKRDVTSITLALYKIFEDYAKKKVIPTVLIDNLVYGDFEIRSEDISHGALCQVSIYKNIGYGAAVPPKSLQALYIDIFGLPRMEGTSVDAIRESIRSAILIDGVADDVVRTLALIYRKYGKEALEFGYTSIGIAGKMRERLEKMFTELGYEAFIFPFAQNPRKDFYYNFSESGWPSRLFTYTNSVLSRHLQYAYYLSVIKAQPMYLGKCVRIIPRAGLTIGLQL